MLLLSGMGSDGPKPKSGQCFIKADFFGIRPRLNFIRRTLGSLPGPAHMFSNSENPTFFGLVKNHKSDWSE